MMIMIKPILRRSDENYQNILSNKENNIYESYTKSKNQIYIARIISIQLILITFISTLFDHSQMRVQP
jgi:hypothetical protein